jgi:hypothetical protein
MRKAAGKLTGEDKKKADVVGEDFCRDFWSSKMESA